MITATIHRIRTKNRRSHGSLIGDDILDEASDYNLGRIDEAQAHVRPPEIHKFYVESEYDERAAQQPGLFVAEGKKESRPFQATADSLVQQADDHEHAITEQRTLVTQSAARLEAARDALHPYTRRAPHDKGYYLVRMILLLVGDVAAMAGAAIALGELVVLAVLQGLAVGAAAVTGGLIGGEVKDARQARKLQKDPDDLRDEEKPYAYLFQGPDDGESLVARMVGMGLLIVVLIFGGVAALRYSTGDLAIGLLFGCLAAAVALASFINAYVTADAVADLLAEIRHEYERDVRKLTAMTRKSPRTKQAKANTEATSIMAEYVLRGAAGAHALHAGGWRVLAANPGVAGHGEAKPGTPEEPLTLHHTPATGLDHKLNQLDRELIELERAVTYDATPASPNGLSHPNGSGHTNGSSPVVD